MEVELFDGRVKAIVDPTGAWITNLSDEYGDVLFPKRTLASQNGSKKVRGGCHVCLPNFGPGGDSGQSQHGFGRAMQWRVVDSTATTVVLELPHGDGEYNDLHSQLSYAIEGNALLMTLTVINKGSNDLRIAPGFHPYFMTARGADVTIIDDELVSLDELNEAHFVTDEKDHTAEISGTIYTLQAEGLPTWARWTDMLGSYVCIEPTVGGFTFLNAQPADNERLSGGQSRRYELRIMWQR